MFLSLSLTHTHRRRFMISALLAAALLASAAFAPIRTGAGVKGPTRTPLPTDNAISVYAGIQGTWQSHINPNLAPMTAEIGTDVSVYALSDTPAADNLADHSLVQMPVPDNPNWYVFGPTTENFNLKFDIADTANRLSRIVVSDLLTGAVIGNLTASPDGSSIVGQLSVPWLQCYYRIDGYNSANGLLFVLGASNGKPDTYVHFTKTGVFEPYRPTTVSSPRHVGGDNVLGPVGDPYNVGGVSTSTPNGPFLSVGCGAKDEKNDVSVSNPMNPPLPFRDYIKKKRIETVDPTNYPSNDKADQPKLADAINAAGVEVIDRALTDITMLPYSDTTGHWHAKFIGQATGFFVVPFTVAKHSNLLTGLKLAFGALTVAYTDHKPILAFALAEKFLTWLTSDSGKQSGLKAGMVIALGDVKTVVVQEDLKGTPVVLGLFLDVNFTLSPDIAPASGSGGGSVVMDGANTTPSPPPAIFDTQLSFALPGWTVTRSLPKGYKYKATGTIVNPMGYEASTTQPIQFLVPGSSSVSVPCTLKKLIALKVKTTGPTGAASALVKVKQGATVVYSGTSTLQTDGTYSITFNTITTGGYQVTATGGAPPVEGPAVSIGVVPALSQTVTVSFASGGGGPPPPPP